MRAAFLVAAIFFTTFVSPCRAGEVDRTAPNVSETPPPSAAKPVPRNDEYLRKLLLLPPPSRPSQADLMDMDENAAPPPARPTPRMSLQLPKPPNPEDLRASLCVRPNRKPIMDAYNSLSEKSRPQRVVVQLRYESDGSTTDVRIGESSGNDNLDAVVLTWARRVKLCPIFGSGEGKLPIEFQTK